MTLVICALIVAAYLLGSIPSAVWISKAFYHIDIREHGSHNAGATNMLRVLGRKAALPVYIIDAAKGYAAVMLSVLTPLEGEPQFYLDIALTAAAVLGHIFPIFAGFRGGKGVSTMAGCLLGIAQVPALMSVATFLIVLAGTHYVSVGSMAAAILFPFYIYLVDGFSSPSKIIFGCLVALAILITHRNNIKRLKAGVESKTYLFLWRKKKPIAADE